MAFSDRFFSAETGKSLLLNSAVTPIAQIRQSHTWRLLLKFYEAYLGCLGSCRIFSTKKMLNASKSVSRELQPKPDLQKKAAIIMH